MGYEVHAETYQGYTLTICHDETPRSPREDRDEVAHMYSWERDYRSPDADHSWRDGEDFAAFLSERKSERHSTDPGVLALALYRNYDGSIRAGEWDTDAEARAIGVVYAKYEEIRQWRQVARLTPAILSQERAAIVAEVAEYSDWAIGNVWGYVISDDARPHIDSCWGYIGDWDGREWGALVTGKEAIDAMIAANELPAPSDEECAADMATEIAEYLAHMAA